ncbi:hypothetical protein GGR21_003963 [Dysgonomonas hofstadii]|uniref:DUF5018 domain-containing protein n=1 Tax=Dysgonomonas hofstadii TaxID=637886 RepID=A0A840CRI4_9BACT|nr:DUF5018 domain-containing protein [Dysgonomonas hofstadii]MBB4038036.1 hypothetical protein [Dysgonomonas hofstadii]
MKKINIKLYIALVLGFMVLFSSCSDDDLSSEAAIINSFTVKNENNTVFRAIINNDNTITIKVSPYLDAEEVLVSAVPTFFLSKGATVEPNPATPQNFAQSGGVKYTVTSEDQKNKREYTVSWGVSDQMAYGEGFSYAEIGTMKDFTQLGYPGELKNFNLADSKQYGDLQLYHAYCGDYIVMLSRAYVNADPTSPYCIKVVDKTSLNDAGSFNLGSISVADLRIITSDYKGNCVGAVTSNNETEFFYWTKPTDSPKSIGKASVNMTSTTDGSTNMQVAGDITENAWITAMAPRGSKGEHYRIKVTSGQLASNYSIIETGYASDDCAGFQMISPLDDSDQPSFIVGDTEGTANAANSTLCYVNTYAGSTISVMPAIWQTLQGWYVGTGFATSRVGGRSPVVSALVINGKSYVIVTSGTSWYHSAAVLLPDLQTLAHENLNIADGVNRAWSFGSWVDWYWDEDQKEAYLAVWFGRLGLYTYKLTCFE